MGNLSMTQSDTGEGPYWPERLCTAVAVGDAEGVNRVFSLLVWGDGERIRVRAMAFLEEFAPSYRAETHLEPAQRVQRLRMDCFRASVLAYLEGRAVDIDLGEEHDIPTWIEANAPAIVSANLTLMEQALGEPGTARHRNVIKLHGLIDLALYEEFQQRALERNWAEVEKALAESLATVR